MEYLTLNNGIEMPKVGLGTFLIPKENITKVIGEAYDMGYRQFDTAWRYHNEREIAKALKANSISREDIFITTKVNADALYYFGYKYGKRSLFNIRSFRPVRKAIEESFEHLGTDYIDLFLVHWPWPIYRKMYKELTSLYYEGRIRAIGVCSCLPPHLEDINYIKKHPKDYFWIDLKEYTLKGLLEFCREIPPLPNVFIETNVDEVVDFLTGKGYNVIYTIRHVGHWYESNILLLKDEISGVIENDPITGLASNHVMYFRMKDTYPLFPKYVWYTSSEGEVDMDIPEQILTDPSVVVLLLDFDDVHELRLYEERVNK